MSNTSHHHLGYHDGYCPRGRRCGSGTRNTMGLGQQLFHRCRVDSFFRVEKLILRVLKEKNKERRLPADRCNVLTDACGRDMYCQGFYIR